MMHIERLICTFTLASTLFHLAGSTPCRAADVVATWDNTAFLQPWSDGTRWTTVPDVSPVVPNNGNGGQTFDVIINIGNAIQDVAGGVVVNNLDLIDGFLSGDQPVTIVGEPGNPLAVSSWSGVTQNTEIWNTGGVTVGADATLEITGTDQKKLGAQNNNGDEVDDLVALTIDGSVFLSGTGRFDTRGEGASLEISSTGSFDWTSNSVLGGLVPGTINNAGSFTRSAGAGLAQISSNWTVNNSGTFRVESGTVQLSSTANGFNNDGTIEVAGNGTNLQLGGGASTGTFDIAADAELSFVSANITVIHSVDGSAAGITNAGALNVDGYLNFVNDASYSGAGAMNLLDGAISGDAAVSVENFTWSGGQIGNTAGVTIPGGATSTISGGTDKAFATSGRLVIEGTVAVTGTGDIETLAASASSAEISIAAGGLLDVQTNADITDGGFSNRGGMINNAGTFQKSGGTGTTLIAEAWTVDNTGTIDVDTGTLEIDGSFAHAGTSAIDVAAGATVQFDGAVTGESSFTGEGSVVFNDDYHPGASPATVSFAGDVAFGASSELFIEIGGTADGEFDALNIAGDIEFLGDLDFNLVEFVPEGGVFEPTPGDSFEVITFAGELAAGSSFEGASLPPAPEMSHWSLEVLDNSVVLSLIEQIENGDFNGDLVVNIADYTVWRDNLGRGDGTPGSLLITDGDANGDGLVDENDYAVWKAQFGTVLTGSASLTLDGSSAIPEPASIATLLIAVAGLAIRRFRAARRDRPNGKQ